MTYFDWEQAKLYYCEEAYYYLLHTHVKNIQEVDFMRGYTSLPHKHCYRELCQDKLKAQELFNKLKLTYGFFIKENFV